MASRAAAEDIAQFHPSHLLYIPDRFRVASCNENPAFLLSKREPRGSPASGSVRCRLQPRSEAARLYASASRPASTGASRSLDKPTYFQYVTHLTMPSDNLLAVVEIVVSTENSGDAASMKYGTHIELTYQW